MPSNLTTKRRNTNKFFKELKKYEKYGFKQKKFTKKRKHKRRRNINLETLFLKEARQPYLRDLSTVDNEPFSIARLRSDPVVYTNRNYFPVPTGPEHPSAESIIIPTRFASYTKLDSRKGILKLLLNTHSSITTPLQAILINPHKTRPEDRLKIDKYTRAGFGCSSLSTSKIDMNPICKDEYIAEILKKKHRDPTRSKYLLHNGKIYKNTGTIDSESLRDENIMISNIENSCQTTRDVVALLIKYYDLIETIDVNGKDVPPMFTLEYNGKIFDFVPRHAYANPLRTFYETFGITHTPHIDPLQPIFDTIFTRHSCSSQSLYTLVQFFQHVFGVNECFILDLGCNDIASLVTKEFQDEEDTDKSYELIKGQFTEFTV